MQIKRKKLILRAVALVVLLVITITSAAVADRSSSETATSTEVQWVTYVDPRFDFSVEYPAGWHLIPRDDSDPKAMSGLVTFSSVAPSTTAVVSNRTPYDPREPLFIIGHYLAEFKPNQQSLQDWTDAYETVSNGSSPQEVYDYYIKSAESVDNRTALSVKGKSALLEFQVTNIPNGEIVWFIWTNIGDSANSEDKALYEHVVSTFSLQDTSPKSLQDIYGKLFKPQPLQSGNANDVDDPIVVLEGTVSLPSASTWTAPTAAGIRYDMLCGSSMHRDDEDHKFSAYAVDIPMYLAAVESAKTSTVDFAGWTTSGWGNLVMASTYNLSPNIFTLHYAHLSYMSVSAGQNLNNGTHIGTSGDSGPSTHHLHFHIRKLSNSANLTGMSGFYPNSNYPFVSANCGYVKR